MARFASEVITQLFVGYGLFYVAVSVGIEEALEVANLILQFATYVGVGYAHTMRGHFDYLCGRLDVRALLYGIDCGCERLVLYENETTAVVDKGVAGNACLLMIWLREATIDDHEFAVSFYGILTVAYVYGYMAVDDVSIVAYYVEGIKDVVYYLLVVA